jgi:hypothetical protein
MGFEISILDNVLLGFAFNPVNPVNPVKGASCKTQQTSRIGN